MDRFRIIRFLRRPRRCRYRCRRLCRNPYHHFRFAILRGLGHLQRYFPGLDSDASGFAELRPFPSQYTIRFMALYIPHRCPKCFESVTLVQPLDKKDMPKGKAKGHCVFCGWQEEIEMYPTAKQGHIAQKRQRK